MRYESLSSSEGTTYNLIRPFLLSNMSFGYYNSLDPGKVFPWLFIGLGLHFTSPVV